MARQIFEYHPRIGYRFIPGLKARILHEGGGYLITVNNMGFRSERDFFNEKRQGVKRILLFGDSFTAGEGVSNKQRYSDLIEGQIPNIEIYNFGLPGTGTDQQYLAYQDFAQNIEHDLLIIAVLVENIRRVVARYRYFFDDNRNEMCYAKPYYTFNDEGKLVLHNVPLPLEPVSESSLMAKERKFIDRGGRFNVIRKFVARSGLKEIAQRITNYQPVPEYNNPNNEAWQVMGAIITEWVARHSRPVLLVPVPLYQYIEETSDASCYQERFREIVAKTGCYLHDPLPDLQRYPLDVRRGFRFKKDIHPTPEGHLALASSLTPIIKQLLLSF